MKPGLAILPLEVWADVFEHPMITRQMMAQIADNNGDPGFTNKLQKLLHGCGKQTLHYLDISSKKPAGESTQEPKIPECQALLRVFPDDKSWADRWFNLTTFTEFPTTEMPENIKTFKLLSISHIDDEVLAFLEKIKSLFTNVYLDIPSDFYSTANMRIVFTHLLPMLGSIRAIHSSNSTVFDDGLQLLEQHFPDTLAQAKELDLRDPNPATILTCLNWLSTPQDFGEHGPRFLHATADRRTNFAIVDAVRKQFLAATTPATFVVYLFPHEDDLNAEEFTIENAATKEELTVRNANRGGYVEIVRNPVGAEAKMRAWINKRAFFDDERNKEIRIWWDPTIGHITKKTDGMDQAEEKPANQDESADEDRAGPSTAAKEMEK